MKSESKETKADKIKKVYKLYNIRKILCYSSGPNKYFDENFKTLFICNMVGISAKAMIDSIFQQASDIMNANKNKYKYKIVLTKKNLTTLFNQEERRQNYNLLLANIKNTNCEVLYCDDDTDHNSFKASDIYFDLKAESLTLNKLKEIFNNYDIAIKKEDFLASCLEGKTLRRRPNYLGENEKMQISEIPFTLVQNIDNSIKNLNRFFEIKKNCKMSGFIQRWDTNTLTAAEVNFLKICKVYDVDISYQNENILKYFKKML